MSLIPSRPIAVPASLLPFLLIVLSAGSACGASSIAATRPATAAIVTRMSGMANSPIGIDHHLTVSVSCHHGEQLLAGGYIAQDVFESDYSVLATYPSAAATWTVSVDSGSTYQLLALVYCLASYPSLGMRILPVNTCPSGAVQTGTGFQRTSPYGPPSTLYVLCSFHDVVSTGTGFRLGSAQVACAHQSSGNSLSESRTFSYSCSIQGQVT